MKYIKRILIILFLVIMISGCKVEYDLKVNDDLSLSETVKITENTNRMKSRTNLDVEQSVKYLYDMYKLDFMGDKNYSISSSGNNTIVTVHNSYKDLEDYQNKFKNEIFVPYNEYEKKNHQVIKISQFKLIDTKASNRSIYDQIDVSIEVPFDVTNTTAEVTNGNTYKWTVKADDTEYKRIILEYNGNKPKNSVAFSFGDIAFHVGYEWIILVGVVVVVAVLLVYIYAKNKKNNRI